MIKECQEALHFLSIDKECDDTKCNECSIKTMCRKYSAIQTLHKAIHKADLINQEFDYSPLCYDSDNFAELNALFNTEFEHIGNKTIKGFTETTVITIHYEFISNCIITITQINIEAI